MFAMICVCKASIINLFLHHSINIHSLSSSDINGMLLAKTNSSTVLIDTQLRYGIPFSSALSYSCIIQQAAPTL